MWHGYQRERAKYRTDGESKMTTTLTITDELLADLKLVKRVLGLSSYTEVIRSLLNSRGYDEKWIEYMNGVLSQEGAR